MPAAPSLQGKKSLVIGREKGMGMGRGGEGGRGREWEREGGRRGQGREKGRGEAEGERSGRKGNGRGGERRRRGRWRRRGRGGEEGEEDKNLGIRGTREGYSRWPVRHSTTPRPRRTACSGVGTIFWLGVLTCKGVATHLPQIHVPLRISVTLFWKTEKLIIF